MGYVMPRTTIIVEGEPVGKSRPRFSRGRVYTPEKTKEYEERIAWTYKKEINAHFDGAVEVEIIVYKAMPKSWSKKLREKRWNKICTNKPDIDNIVKSILDGLQKGGAFNDDKQVGILKAYKRWGESPRVFVDITEIRE